MSLAHSLATHAWLASHFSECLTRSARSLAARHYRSKLQTLLQLCHLFQQRDPNSTWPFRGQVCTCGSICKTMSSQKGRIYGKEGKDTGQFYRCILGAKKRIKCFKDNFKLLLRHSPDFTYTGDKAMKVNGGGITSTRGVFFGLRNCRCNAQDMEATENMPNAVTTIRHGWLQYAQREQKHLQFYRPKVLQSYGITSFQVPNNGELSKIL